MSLGARIPSAPCPRPGPGVSVSSNFKDWRANMRLENEQTLPNLVAPTVEGTQKTIPADLDGSWSVVLFYRGEW